jgi:VWFA-related protein
MKDVLRSRWGWGWVFVAGLVLALPAAAQFSDTTDVVVVEVPVQVLAKDGTPVRGLTANDFEVYEGRKKLQVTGFEVLDLEVAPADMPVADMPTAARRHFLMLFDLSFAEPKSIIKARQAAADVVDSLHPTDLVAVATYAQSTGPQLVLGFTPDRRQAKLALDTLGLPQLVDRTPDPLRMVMSEARDAMQKAPGSEASGKRVDMAEQVLEHLEGLYRESDRANQVVMQNKVKALTRSFADLARLMAGIQGRKHVVYLSRSGMSIRTSASATPRP